MELLEPLLDALHLHARHAAVPADAAGDLVQEAGLIGWREYPRFQPGTSFRAWMFRILVNVVWKHNKRSARWRDLEHADALEVDLANTLEVETAWSELLRDERQLGELIDGRLASALASLSPVVRQCLLLRWLEDMSYREIADMLELPAGTVMSHVHRARSQLRERLARLAAERGLHLEQGR